MAHLPVYLCPAVLQPCNLQLLLRDELQLGRCKLATIMPSLCSRSSRSQCTAKDTGIATKQLVCAIVNADTTALPLQAIPTIHGCLRIPISSCSNPLDVGIAGVSLRARCCKVHVEQIHDNDIDAHGPRCTSQGAEVVLDPPGPGGCVERCSRGLRSRLAGGSNSRITHRSGSCARRSSAALSLAASAAGTRGCHCSSLCAISALQHI
jgi:hypothetical protein